MYNFCLSIILSVRQFYQEWVIIFSSFFHDVRQLKYLKNGRTLSSRKIHISPNLGKRAQNGPKIGVFSEFLKALSLVFPENNLECKLILLLIFHHPSHV